MTHKSLLSTRASDLYTWHILSLYFKFRISNWICGYHKWIPIFEHYNCIVNAFARCSNLAPSAVKPGDEYIRIKKDIFHAFHMIPISVNHGHCSDFLRSLQDHLMHWDPVIQSDVDKTCQKVYGVGLYEMLICNPYSYCSCPWHWTCLQHVWKGPWCKDRCTTFFQASMAKGKCCLKLAYQGYLSDLDGVVLYEQAGIDQHGLQLWTCLCGTNKVEGGPHGDIYCKFGALHGKSSYYCVAFLSCLYICIYSWTSSGYELFDRSSYLVHYSGLYYHHLPHITTHFVSYVIGIC